MPSLNASVIGSLEYSKQLGKKSGETDVTFYDLKKGETVITLVEPSRYPEKIQSLYFSTAFGEYAVLVTEKIDQYFGESLLMLNAVGVKAGTIVLRNYIQEEQLTPLRRGTVLENYTVMEDDPNRLRDHLITVAERPRQPASGPGTLSVDAAFNVHGIGTVALANIKFGSLRKHDVLKVMPGIKTAEVRSIQKHDVDIDSAIAGDHVGIALKGVEASDLDRGTVLTGVDLKETSTITAKAQLIPYFQAQLHEGSTLHLGHWLQLNLGRVTRFVDSGNKNPEMTVQLERPIVHPAGANAVLIYLDGGKLRVAGTITLP